MTRVQDHYAAKIAEGLLQSDPAQVAVLPEFERMRAALAEPVKKEPLQESSTAAQGPLYLGRRWARQVDDHGPVRGNCRNGAGFDATGSLSRFHAGNPRSAASGPQNRRG